MWKSDKLHTWLSNSVTESQDKRYRHRLMKEKSQRTDEVINELKRLVAEAYEDAKQLLRGFIGTQLDPLETGVVIPDLAKGYPEILPLSNLKGDFGEIFAGLVAENFAPFGIDDWVVPAFLFKFHDTAFDRFEKIRDIGEQTKSVLGRPGNDCLAFQFGDDGRVKKSLFCEAKCSGDHDSELIADGHKQLSNRGNRPESVRQIIEILKERLKNNPPNEQVLDWIIALEGLRRGDVDKDYSRYDMMIYVYGRMPKIPKRITPNARVSWIPRDKPHANYTANRRLEVVEIHIHEVDKFIQAVHEKPGTPDEEAKLVEDIRRSPSFSIVELAQQYREKLTTSLLPVQSMLYSQHTHLREGQAGLPSWTPELSSARLDDAVKLIESAFIEKEANQGNNWQKGVLRAAELLEWLNHAEINTDNLPLNLLSSAAYQLAGYPARASALLKQPHHDNTQSLILTALLKADFPELLRRLTQYWAEHDRVMIDLDFSPNNFQAMLVQESVKVFGVLCAEMRWGGEKRINDALKKFNHISKIFLHGEDFYSWLLAKLCNEVIQTYLGCSMHSQLTDIQLSLNPRGRKAIERYLRLGYQRNQTLTWPSQIKGFEQLKTKASFALCTPTGSGKTTVAEIAILQSLFPDKSTDANNFLNPVNDSIALYLVPSRALAAEVETKLARVLKNLEAEIVVTGLYGGLDWGPTDVWLTEQKPTVVICTYEKAEALMRFLGHAFRHRLSLIVIDEAHLIQYDGNVMSLQKTESRSLRLESLMMRLLAFLKFNASDIKIAPQVHTSTNPLWNELLSNMVDTRKETRVIALSAVAEGIENSLAHWVSDNKEAKAEKTMYRSTRQLIGRLEYSTQGKFKIHYDLLDRANLHFKKQNTETTYIPNPFPAYPPLSPDWNKKNSDEQKITPALFWAAMYLAKPDEGGQPHAILISITEHIETYSRDFLTLLTETWKNIELPQFFQPPINEHKQKLWHDCINSCEDYFGKNSYEYQLLEKGIVVHHGKMPGRMAQLLVQIVQARIVNIILATSTLSDGVNLPFEIVLIPNITRKGKPMPAHEFGNLVGRAGRPGVGVEGRSLVMLREESKREQLQYNTLIRQLEQNTPSNLPQSPLAELLNHLEILWRKVEQSDDRGAFLIWLEKTEPLQETRNIDLIETLDALDAILLSAIVEFEDMSQFDFNLTTLEEKLRLVWQSSFAYYAHDKQNELETLFITRGVALQETIYQDEEQRKRFYTTSLPPRSAHKLIQLYPIIKQHLETGKDYADWDDNKRVEFIQTMVEIISALDQFKLKKSPNQTTWQNILRWWFGLLWNTKFPSKDQISKWQGYVSQNFIYRSTWGLGSVIGLAVEETFGGQFSDIESWPETGLPWIVFWLKELITWGTLDPVAAYLLARNLAVTRNEAQEKAKEYYSQNISPLSDERLNAKSIQTWAQNYQKRSLDSTFSSLPTTLPVYLLRDFSQVAQGSRRVVPVERDNEIYWFDLAGSSLARCVKPAKWETTYLDSYDFELNPSKTEVSWTRYV